MNRKTLKRLCLLATALILAVATAEIALRLAGLPPWSEPFAEFDAADGTRMARFTLNIYKPEFPVKKTEGTFRIMLAGASSTIGFPFQPRSSFGMMLEDMLGRAFPGKRAEVIPLGKMSMYSGEVADVVLASLKYEPDLVIVYSGHNEFISLNRRPPSTLAFHPALTKRSRLLSSLAGIPTWLETLENLSANNGDLLYLPPPGPISREQYERALQEYSFNLERLVNACQSAGVPVLVCTVPANTRDWPPDHAFPKGVDNQGREILQAAVENARKLSESACADLTDTTIEKALSEIGRAMEVPDDYAPLFFYRARLETRMAECADGSGEERKADLDNAAQDFSKAVSVESRASIMHRTAPELNTIVRKTAERSGCGFLDLEAVFNRESPPAPGFELFADQCHPNLDGQRLIAQTLASYLAENVFHAAPSQAGWEIGRYYRDRKIDEGFLHHVHLTMAIFIGIKQELPRESAGIREHLQKAKAGYEKDPLTLLLQALLALRYDDPSIVPRELIDLYATNPEAVEQAVERYFSGNVAIKESTLLARLDTAFFAPPFSGLIRRDFFSDKKQEKPTALALSPKSFNRWLDLQDGSMGIGDPLQ